MTDFDILARYYDLDFQDRLDDLGLYQAFALRCGSPILEIGVGTGRVAIPLAQAGYQVTGVDISPAMLDAARKKSRRAGVERRVALVEADARHLALGQEFTMAFVAASSFMHFVTTADQNAVLGSIRAHLRPGGLLIIDLVSPDELLAQPDGVVVHEYTRVDPQTGHRVMKFQVRQIDRVSQTINTQLFYDEIDGDGALHRTLASLDLHYFVRSELTLLLTSNGYRIEQVYGSYDLEEYSFDSLSMIFVAARTND